MEGNNSKNRWTLQKKRGVWICTALGSPNHQWLGDPMILRAASFLNKVFRKQKWPLIRMKDPTTKSQLFIDTPTKSLLRQKKMCTLLVKVRWVMSFLCPKFKVEGDFYIMFTDKNNIKILHNEKHYLVGGWTNPSEKYAHQIGSFPQGFGWK